MAEAGFTSPMSTAFVLQGEFVQHFTLNNGLSMPAVGFGTWSLKGEACVRAVRTAFDCGIRLVDTASFYENEREVGRAVREAVRSGIPREEIFVETKLYLTQYGDPEGALRESLEKLGLEYVDMMVLHHPGAGDTAVYRTLERAAERGLVRSIGLSNWYVKELSAFLPRVETQPALVQNEIHPFYQEQDVVPFIQQKGIAVQSWYPLGGRGWTKAILTHSTITAIAERLGKTPAQVVLRWHLERGVAVIPGSSDPAHIRENAELFDFSLTEDDLRAIGLLDRGEKHDWY